MKRVSINGKKLTKYDLCCLINRQRPYYNMPNPDYYSYSELVSIASKYPNIKFD